MATGRTVILLGAVAAVAVPLAVYLVTLAPGVNFEDPLEFAIGGATLGVNHPSGYPLLTLVAHLFTYIPFAPAAWAMNAASAVAAAAACLFVYLLVTELVRDAPAASRAIGGWLGAGVLAFSRTFWQQATITETYALNAALVAAALWLGARGWRDRDDARPFVAAAFVAGLGAANHPTSLVLTGPVLTALAIRRRGNGWALAAGLFVLALGLYLYLPLRASREPPLNWGQPDDWLAFREHVFRREFGSIFWPRYRWFGLHAAELGRFVLLEFAPGPGVAAVAAFALLVARRGYGRVAAALAVLAGPAMLAPLVGLLTPIQVFEIDVWYIAFFMLLAVALGAGGAWFGGRFRRGPAARLALVVLAAVPLYPLVYNFAYADRRGHDLAAAHGRNLLRSFPKEAAIAVSFYERLGLFELSYPRIVLGRRPDLAVADSRNTVRSDLTAAKGAPIYVRDPDAAEKWWYNYKEELVRRGGRPIFHIADEVVAPAWRAEERPFGLVYHLRPQGEPTPWPTPRPRFETAPLADIEVYITSERTSYDRTTFRVWTMYYASAAEEAFAGGDDGRALVWLAAATKTAPRDGAVAWWLANRYERYGYPEKALPLYLSALAAEGRLAHDDLMFRREYAQLLASVGQSYLELGDAARAGRFFRASLAVNPDQPFLRNHANDRDLAAAAAFFQERRAAGVRLRRR